MENYVITKKELIDYANALNNKLVLEAVAIRIKKQDILLSKANPDHKAWVELVNAAEKTEESNKNKVVCISSQQLDKLLNSGKNIE